MYYTRLFELGPDSVPGASAVGEIVLLPNELKLACSGLFGVSQGMVFPERERHRNNDDQQDLDLAARVRNGALAAMEYGFSGAVVVGDYTRVDRVARLLGMTDLGLSVEEHVRPYREYMEACAGKPTPFPDMLHTPVAWIGNDDISIMLPPNAYVYDPEAPDDVDVSSPADRLAKTVWESIEMSDLMRPPQPIGGGVAFLHADPYFMP